ncbi:uncharacterized protein PGTG_13164 [Puccinia graminis f. sp. tritici CRL 75-36-700-3]|uniref:No apical meristem-associated C-terminal domain-containing protein n=1 Tax=Puccinia graminis f. sp. tritici (strain CRL 75-36-700-3 / race SCCL) TaxID=418459 RepID=E3KR57_PUCGT|nr:uncharacterized protein PGTG_13164 [Puccinia graminis f. sp. tritici CRL 75-36-700-3]EFP86782.2 hypothetical protein PGTG_13164 [Puccinia graminis f. sp. tritici CRL 75-36-700-3]
MPDSAEIVSGYPDPTRPSLMYSKLQERRFKYMACYDLLSKAPKWHDYNAAMTKKCEQKKKPSPNPSSPLPASLPSSTSADTVHSTSDASGDETVRGKPTRPIGWKKAKVAYQEEKLDASNHEHLKKMATAHIDIAEVAKMQHTALASGMSAQHSALKCLSDEAIMNKDLTGADDDVKKYYILQRKRILDRLEQEMATPTLTPAPALALTPASAPATVNHEK